MIDDLKMEKKAIEFRESLGLSTTAPFKVYEVLRKLNVITSFEPMDPGVS